MENTHTVQVLIKDALRQKGRTLTWLGEAMGHDQSWASKLVGGTTKRISQDQAEQLYDLLGIDFAILKRKQSPLLEAIIEQPVLAEACQALHKALEGKIFTIGDMPTKKLHEIGKKIQQLAVTSESPADLARGVMALFDQK